MILTKDVQVDTLYMKYFVKDWYIQKGYDVSQKSFIVKVDDLYSNSKTKILTKCDYCGKIFERSYNRVNKHDKHSCNQRECKNQLRKELNLDKYGVENINQIPGIKQKGANTFRERYGNDSPIHDEYMKKIQQTNIKQFGVPYVFNDKEKMHNMNVKKVATKCNNGTMEISKPQKYLADIFNARTNYPFDVYALDIVLFKNDMKIDIEYDGWGHFYFCKNKNNDAVRDEFLISNGWKILRVKSKKDLLYDKDNMIYLLNKSLDKLRQIDKIIINIDDDLFISDGQEVMDFNKSTDYLKELK